MEESTKLRLIADAELSVVVFKAKRRTVSVLVARSILSVIAGHEYEPLSYVGIEARCNIAHWTACCGVASLIRQGVVVRLRTRGMNRVSRYRVDWEQLAAMATKEPTVKPSGHAPVYHDIKHVMKRVHERARAAAKRNVQTEAA